MSETIADIVREMRKGFNQSWRDVAREWWAHDLADRIEAAWKRETQKPLRNCDVGTIEEQYDRFCMFCRQYRYCNDCQFAKLFDARYGIRSLHVCAWAWAQMPYEEGGAK